MREPWSIESIDSTSAIADDNKRNAGSVWPFLHRPETKTSILKALGLEALAET